MTNPAKTLWWETFELWDVVLYQLGNAYYKVRRPAGHTNTTSRPPHKHRTKHRRRRVHDAAVAD